MELRINKKIFRQSVKVFIGISLVVALIWVLALTQSILATIILVPFVGVILFVMIRTEKDKK